MRRPLEGLLQSETWTLTRRPAQTATRTEKEKGYVFPLENVSPKPHEYFFDEKAQKMLNFDSFEHTNLLERFGVLSGCSFQGLTGCCKSAPTDQRVGYKLKATLQTRSQSALLLRLSCQMENEASLTT
jgi:hypothetical protein